ncbi:hypothetical protein M0813_11760 [Anaeramoeba flamelloides]|uniref:B box-type domain-containing protein n=1 Tax=Anaeramoeba flamelloides TaxID=1746091 RepID=A0ABQ8ZDJ0_9EUKA|nr:hypothetical protein M0813_11760 [Anaeramoeba flamelloides]
MTSYFPIQPEEENIQEKTIWCDNCLEEDYKKVKAIVYCHDCEKNLCKNCDTIHQFSGYKNHIRDLQQSDLNFTENCPINQKSKLCRYCKNCQKLICSEFNYEHTNHEIISFDQSMDFYQELINEQKQCTQNHFERTNLNLEQLNNSEKNLKKNKETIFKKKTDFYKTQKKLLDLLEQNEIKLTNNFFEQISSIMKIEKQKINNSKSTTQKLLNEFKKLETKINQSNSFGFFKLFSEMQLIKTQENPNSKFPRLCNEHKNQPYQYFCLDHQHLLCVDCVILNHRRCNQIVNFKVGYEKIQNQLKELTNEIKTIKDKKVEFVEKIQNEKFNSLKEKQINLKLIKTNYQKLNEITQYQFRNMKEYISIHQNEKFIQLSHQLNKIQKEIEIFEKSENIIKEIEICKKYNDYQQILRIFFKLKQLLPRLNKIKKNKLICNSKFKKINLIPNDLLRNLKNWKLIFQFDSNKTQINLPDYFQLKKQIEIFSFS